MRHRKAGRKLGRTSSHRKAMFRNLVTSLLEHERVMTTDAKAKEIRRWVDWMITLGKRGDLAARRQVLQVVRDKSVVYKIFVDLGQRFQKINGGYSRIVKIGYRRGDGAPMSIIELVEHGEIKSKKSKHQKPAEKVEAIEESPQVTGEREIKNAESLGNQGEEIQQQNDQKLDSSGDSEDKLE